MASEADLFQLGLRRVLGSSVRRLAAEHRLLKSLCCRKGCSLFFNSYQRIYRRRDLEEDPEENRLQLFLEPTFLFNHNTDISTDHKMF